MAPGSCPPMPWINNYNPSLGYQLAFPNLVYNSFLIFYILSVPQYSYKAWIYYLQKLIFFIFFCNRLYYLAQNSPEGRLVDDYGSEIDSLKALEKKTFGSYKGQRGE